MQREPLDFFDHRMRRLLVEHGLECRGAAKPEAVLRLEHRALLAAGGDSDTAVVPGGASSPLSMAVWAEGDLDLFPDQRRDEEEIRVLKPWLDEGAVGPDSVTLEAEGTP
jgi:hypothetical protein